MDDDEGRAQPGSPEARNASLEEQKPPGDDIAAREAETPPGRSGDDGPSEQTSVTQVEPIVAGAEVTAVSPAEQTAVTQVVPTGGETAVTQVAPTPPPSRSPSRRSCLPPSPRRKSCSCASTIVCAARSSACSWC